LICCLKIIPAAYVETSLGLIYEIDAVIGKYLRGLMIETTLVAVFTILGLLAPGRGLRRDRRDRGRAGQFDTLRRSGGRRLLAITLGLIKFKSAAIVIQIIVLFLVIHIIDADIVQPVVIGRGVNIPAIIIDFFPDAGGETFRSCRLVIAVPARR